MARRYLSALTVKTSCAAAADQTLVQLRAGVIPLTLIEWGVSFDGITSTATPARVTLQLQTDSGTMTQIGRGQKLDSLTTGSFASYRVNATSEPTDGAILAQGNITPIGGLFEKQWPLGREIQINPDERVSVIVSAFAGSAVSALGQIIFEE